MHHCKTLSNSCFDTCPRVRVETYLLETIQKCKLGTTLNYCSALLMRLKNAYKQCVVCTTGLLLITTRSVQSSRPYSLQASSHFANINYSSSLMHANATKTTSKDFLIHELPDQSFRSVF